MTLAEYLQKMSSTPFARGKSDCCIFVADWVRDQTGKDPAEGHRDYFSDRGAMIKIGRAGGFLELGLEAMRKAGLRRVRQARVGDVGIVETGGVRTSAIKTSTGWACKESNGLIIGPFKPVVIWRLPGNGN